MAVSPPSTSPTGSRCGRRQDPGAAAVSRCLPCEVAIARDQNAALTILRAGTAPAPAGRDA